MTKVVSLNGNRATPEITKVNYLNLTIVYGAAIVSAYVCSLMAYEWRYDVLSFFAKSYMGYYKELNQPIKQENINDITFENNPVNQKSMIIFKNNKEDFDRNSTSHKASNQTSQKGSNILSGSQWRNSAPPSQ